MANNIDPYDPTFYAQEALLVLEKALGMAGRIHRGYENERNSYKRGQTIEIKKPGTFTTQAGGTGTLQDVDPTNLELTLDTWREVKFGLTDKELAYTGEEIIRDHISPAVYALATYVETKLTDLYKDIPWFYPLTATPVASDIVNTRKILRDQAGSLIDRDIIHFGIDSTVEAAFLNSTLFHSASVADKDSENSRKFGHLGTRFGVESFVQQTMSQHTSGTIVSAGTDLLGALAAAGDKGDTTINVSGFDGVETFVAGDTIVIASNTQRYVVTATTTMSGGANAAVPIYPALVDDYLISAVVTAETKATAHADAYYPNIMFHRNAFAMALAPLPEIGHGAGANMRVITDHRTGMSIRARLAYDDDDAKVKVTLDILFGVKTLDPNLAVIARRNA